MIQTIAALRIRFAGGRGACILLLAGIVGCAPPIPGRGGAVRAGGVTRIGSDLVGAHGDLSIADSVPGDVMVAGGDIRFTGTAGGDYIGAGGQQIISGRVGRAVRAAGGHLEVTADIGSNATIAGANIEVGETANINGNAYLAGTAVRVDGRVGQTLVVRAGDVVLDGVVGGDVNVEAGTLRIGPGATIDGDLTYRARGDVAIDPGARIVGTRVRLPAPPPSRFPQIFRGVWLIGFLVAGASIVLLAPGLIESAAAAVGRSAGASIGWGLAFLIGVPVAAGILAITLIGIPLALVVGALYIVSLYLARAVPALLLGRLVLRDRVGTSRRATLLTFLVGGAILGLIELIPFVGPAVMIAATILGLGAAAITVHAAVTRKPAYD